MDIVSSAAKRFLHERTVRTKTLTVLVVLAAVVAALVFWKLHSTGIAMTNAVYCGLEEHTHDESCYEQVLVCGLEEGEVTAVYETEEVLICGNEEEDHVHTEECYETREVLVSGSETPHEHSAECYETVLTCGMEEHVHTIACMTDETADVETAAQWEATLPGAMRGIWAEDVVLVAKSQIGYKESTRNFILAEDGLSRQGYTRYGAWYGNPYGDWRAMVASFCLHYAGVPESVFPEASGVYAWTAALRNMGLYADAGSYIPAPGDLIFLDTDSDGQGDHVGIVEEVKTKTDKTTGEETAVQIRTIEGNAGDAVIEKKYSADSGAILGYGMLPPQNPNAESQEENADPASNTVVYTAEDGGISVTVTAPEGALPKDAVLSVKQIRENSRDYSIAETALKEASPIEIPVFGDETEEDPAEEPETGMAVVDICFLLDGEETEPTEPVTVAMDVSGLIPEDADPDCIAVHHIQEGEDGAAAVLVADAQNGFDAESLSAEFTVDSFSAFTIEWQAFPNGMGWHSNTITVTVYDINNNAEIAAGDVTSTYELPEETAGDPGLSNSWENRVIIEDLVRGIALSENYSGYHFIYASVSTPSVSGLGSEDNSAASIDLTYYTTWLGVISHWTYTVNYADGSQSNTVSAQSQDYSDLTIRLYYAEPEVSINASIHEDNYYTLTPEIRHFSDTPTYTWSLSDESLGTLTPNEDGTCIFTWAPTVEARDTVDITVTAEYDGEGDYRETATDSITLTDGAVAGTVHVTYRRNTTTSNAALARVAIHDLGGTEIFTGVTDEDGNVAVVNMMGEPLLVSGHTYYVDIEYTYDDETDYGLNSFTDDEQGHRVLNSDALLEVILDGASYAYNLDNAYSTYDHIDVDVSGTYTVTVNGSPFRFTSYIDPDYRISVELPDGEIITDNGTQLKSGEAGMGYHFEGTYSGQWDDWEHAESKSMSDGTQYYETQLLGIFRISGYVLISKSELNEYVDDGALTREEAESLFRGFETVTVNNHMEDAGIPQGEYYLVNYSGYMPQVNLCTEALDPENNAGGRGYDFRVDLNEALVYISDELIVEKYVVDENGYFLYPDDYNSLPADMKAAEMTPAAEGTDNTVFTFTLMPYGGGDIQSVDLKSGAYHSFRELEEGYYTITETPVSGYVPVVWDGKTETWNPSAYIQYTDPEQKDKGGILAVTFYNMKQETYGTVTVTSETEDNTTAGFGGKYFRMHLYTAEETGGEGSEVYSNFKEVAGFGTADNTYLQMKDGESRSFSLPAGTYFIRETDLLYESAEADEGKSVESEISWKKTCGGLADFEDTDGTRYFRFTVEPAGSVNVNVTNTFSLRTGFDVTIRNTDISVSTLTGALFSLMRADESGNVYYNGYDEDLGDLGWTDGDPVLLASGKDGKLYLPGLTDGTYLLSEAQAPDGLSPVKPVTLTVADGSITLSGEDVDNGLVETDDSYGRYTPEIIIKNVPGPMLPMTGGPGTGMYFFGGLLILLAGAAFAAVSLRRRKRGSSGS